MKRNQPTEAQKAASILGRRSAKARISKWRKAQFLRKMRAGGKTGGRPKGKKKGK